MSMVTEKFDIVVVGATPGGLLTAVRAAREGLRVLVATHTHYLGGMLSSGLGVWDTCYAGARAPLVEEFIARVEDYYSKKYGEQSEQLRTYRRTRSVEPRCTERVFNELVEEQPSLSLLKRVYPIAVERDERHIQAIIFKEMDTPARHRIEGAHFVDSTYEGDLLAVAGVPYRVGREARDEYGEPHAGRIFTQFTYGAFPYEAELGKLNLEPFNLNSLGVFAGSTGEGDDAVQAYNFRSILCSDPDNRRPIEKPANYDRSTYLVLLMSEAERSDKSYPFRSTWLIQDIRQFKFKNWKELPNRKLSWNHGGYVGQNHEYPRGSWQKRAEIAQRHKDFDMGLLYFLQNDEAVPEEVRSRASEWGLAKDEFTDNDNFPYELYVREARRLVGRYVFTEHDASLASGLKRTPIHDDSIAIAEWPMDSHECRMERQAGSASDGMILLNEKTRPAQIPFRSLLPAQLDNLVVGVCISATHIGWGTVRVEPTLMHIGEAIGYALAMAHRQGIAVVEVDIHKLQHKLVQSGVMLTFYNDLDMQTQQRWVAAVQFLGTKGFFTSYDARPEAPLDATTMPGWARLVGKLIAGEAKNVNEVARELARMGDPTPDSVITVHDLLTCLEREFAYRQFPSSAISAVNEVTKALELQPTTPLSRGEASLLLYGVIDLCYDSVKTNVRSTL